MNGHCCARSIQSSIMAVLELEQRMMEIKQTTYKLVGYAAGKSPLAKRRTFVKMLRICTGTTINSLHAAHTAVIFLCRRKRRNSAFSRFEEYRDLPKHATQKRVNCANDTSKQNSSSSSNARLRDNCLVATSHNLTCNQRKSPKTEFP